MRGRGVLLLALALVWSRGAEAQDTLPDAPPGARSWLAPLASLVVPGAGQLLLGQDRGVIYLAVEGFALGGYLHDRGVGRTEGDRFRDLAFDVARRPYTPQLRDTTFEYFEVMTRFVESGAFDLDPGPALVPESDLSTYNGAVWLLARRTFWTDPDVPPDPASPEYFRAVQFYQERAVGPGFQWSWRDAPLELESFRLAIRRSDAAYRRASNSLGLLLANHVLSVADALVSSRLTRLAGRPVNVMTRVRPHTARVSVVIAR